VIHESIVRAADNAVLAGLYESISARIRRARFITPMSPEHWTLAVQEHEGILNALQRRDASGLAHILRTHLRRKREEVVQAGFAEASESRALSHRQPPREATASPSRARTLAAMDGLKS
jgi:DNA-binding GntR family transcriptional regulator